MPPASLSIRARWSRFQVMKLSVTHPSIISAFPESSSVDHRAQRCPTPRDSDGSRFDGACDPRRQMLRTSSEDDVERGLARAAEAGEAAGGDDLAQPLLAGLGTERLTIGHHAVEPEAVADHHQRRAHRSAEVADEATHELIRLGLIDGLCSSGHVIDPFARGVRLADYRSSQTWTTVWPEISPPSSSITVAHNTFVPSG